MFQDLGGHVTAIVAIVAIGALEGIAILHGTDGSLLGAAIAIIAGLGGYTVANVGSGKRNGGNGNGH